MMTNAFAVPCQIGLGYRLISILRVTSLVVTLLVVAKDADAQGFINLNFDQSTIISSDPSGYGYNIGSAQVTGWTTDSQFTQGSTVLYNQQTIDSGCVSLFGADYVPWSAVQGQYSVYLKNGAYSWGPTFSSSIGQTGQIPTWANSMTYIGSSYNLQITFNGNLLSFTAVNNNPNYTTYTADISSFAGQTGLLLFTAPASGGSGLIDNIQFHTTAVPEPHAASLCICGIAGLLWWRKRMQ
jgi:hypothetical protein